MLHPGWFLFQVLPEGFSIPNLIYLIPLIVLTIGVVAVAVLLNAPISDDTVVAFAPWMALGAVFHVLYQQNFHYQQWALPDSLEPLFGAPAVYLTTFIIAGLTWIFSTLYEEMRANVSVERELGSIGLGLALVFT
ncbi:MAG: putative membrane protein, partial [Halobacteriales archaeon]